MVPKNDEGMLTRHYVIHKRNIYINSSIMLFESFSAFKYLKVRLFWCSIRINLHQADIRLRWVINDFGLVPNRLKEDMLSVELDYKEDQCRD